MSVDQHELASEFEAVISQAAPDAWRDRSGLIGLCEYGSCRPVVPRFAPDARKANRALVDRLNRIAAVKEVSPAQVALAWLLARKPWIVPIPGTTKLHRLEENNGAADVDLTRDDLRNIDQALSGIKVQGARYPERLMKLVGR